MIIRDFEEKDRADFLAMSRDFYKSGAALRDIPDENRERAFDEIVSGSSLIKGLIFEEGGVVLGYGLLMFFFSCEAGKKVCFVDEVYVKPNFSGKGCGSMYFDYLFKTYPDCCFRLETEPNNVRAVKLYKRLGFERLDYVSYIKN